MVCLLTVLARVLDLGAAVLAEDDLVADVDVERDAVAGVVDARLLPLKLGVILKFVFNFP